MRYLVFLCLFIAALFLGFQAGKFFTSRNNNTELIQNYSFLRDIAELASLEVTGTTTITSSNVNNDGSFTDEMKRLFVEQTVRVSAPYTAKYGVDLQDSSLHIERNDSVLKIYLPPPKLLSYEINLNRMEASNRKGWFRLSNDETYNAFQKKMYAQSRGQLEKNEVFLKRSQDKVCNIIQKYFAPLNIRTICVFEVSALNMRVQNP